MEIPVGSTGYTGYGQNTFAGANNTLGGSGFMGFAPSFAMYPIEGDKLAAVQALSYHFENLWGVIRGNIGLDAAVLSSIKTNLDNAYIIACRKITKPIVNTTGTGVMAF